MRIIVFILCLWAMEGAAQSPVFQQSDFTDVSRISEIEQDSFGFLWIGSKEGLSIYTGYEQQIVDDSKGEVSALQNVGSMMWVGFDNGKLAMYCVSTQMLLDSINLSSSRITDIEIDGGKAYISSYGEGVFIVDVSEYETEKHILLPTKSQNIYEMAIGPKAIYCASDRGIYSVALNGHEVLKLVTADPIVTNVIYRDNRLLYSDFDQHIYELDLGNSQKVKHTLRTTGRIYDILYENERIWCAGSNYLSSFTDEGLLYYENIATPRALLLDDESNLWIGTDKGELIKANLLIQKFPELSEYNIQCAEMMDQRFLFGTDRGLYRVELDGKSKLVMKGNVTCMLQQGENIVVGTYSSGVFVLDKDGGIVNRIKMPLIKENAILDIARKSDRTILISTLAGIDEISYDGLFRNITSVSNHQEFSLNYVYDILQDNIGRTWFGKDLRGFSIQENGITSDIDSIDQKRIGSVYSLAETMDGRIWLSSSELGLLCYAGDSLVIFQTNFTKEDPFTSIISTADNLVLVRKKSVALLNVKHDRIMYFDKEYEEAEEEPFLNNFINADNKVSFVHHNQLYSVTPIAKNQKLHPLTRLDQVEVNLAKVGLTKKAFKHFENNLKFSFTAGWLTDPTKLSYAYKLDGFDEEWRYTKDRSAEYPKLAPGKYSFQVKSAENDHFSGEPIARYDFRIQQAFYKSFWFYFLLIGICAALFYIWLQRRRKQLELINSLEKNKIEGQLLHLKAQLNPHFLFNSLNTLTGLIEESADDAGVYVDHISDYYRSILDIGKKELIPLSQEIELLDSYTSLLKVRFANKFTIEKKLKELNGLTIPPMSLQLLVENAIKHNQLSKEQPIEITITQQERSIVVRNNKVLKRQDPKSPGKGLQNIIERFKLLGLGEVRVLDDASSFTVYLPLKKANESNNS